MKTRIKINGYWEDAEICTHDYIIEPIYLVRKGEKNILYFTSDLDNIDEIKNKKP